MREKATWDGTWTNQNGTNTHPHKAYEEPVHGPMDYSSHDVNQQVA